jgi:hypothetical protein
LKVPATNPGPSPTQNIQPQQNAAPELQPNAQQNVPNDQDNPFAGQGFNAGVEADEDTDPKKYIEQLTGKLAQKLRDYNGTDEDSDLNKFVINSLIPAAVPSLDDQDAKDVIDKVKNNIGKNEGNSENEIPQDNNQDQAPVNQEEPTQQTESKHTEIDELVNEILGHENKLQGHLSGHNKSPFKSPKFR